MENTTKQEQMENALISYVSDFHGSRDEIVKLVGKDNDELSTLIGLFSREWDSVDCDEEGPTHEQDEKLDRILADYASQLCAL